MSLRNHETTKLLDAFSDFIIGKSARRSKLLLVYDGTDVTRQFVETLTKHSYIETTVGAIEIEPGERVPAFYIESSTAYFGWVFWEKFTEKKMRKLWGSVIRNQKGDWAIQIPPSRNIHIYANQELKIEMDIDLVL